jgi:CheY-like chemotaxis protein
MHDQPSIRRRIIVVDRHEDTREMYVAYLRARGFELFSCGAGRAAFATAIRTAPTAVVTAVRLSGRMDGLELATLLRADARTADSSIIVLTTMAFGRDRARMDRCGCDAVLLLPCFPDVLELEIQRAVVSRAIGRSATRGNHEQFLRQCSQRHALRPPRA